jgi:hypothetical protein
MRRLLTFCLAGSACVVGACAGSSAAAAQAADVYPLAQVLSAARDACSNLSSRDAAAAKVAASGWTKAADPYATPVGDLVRLGYEAGRKIVEGRDGKMDAGPLVFSRNVAGETLHLVLSSVEVGGSAVMGCRTYDVGETRRIDQPAASAWAGRKPDNAVARAGVVKYTWEPGLVPGQDSFEIFYVPAGSPLIALIKVSGIAIKADQVSDLQR